MAKRDMALSKDERIIAEAKARFKRCEEWERSARNNYRADMRFANGDSVNMYQWDSQIHNERSAANKPCLTINKTKQHCLQIINDQRQNPSQVEVRPVGNGASYQAAKVFEGIVRHIEYNSNAQSAYSNASYSQVIGGIGYIRIVTDYASPDSFDQEIFIRRVADPLSIYLDPDIQEADGSDAKFACVFSDMPRDEFEREYQPDDDDIPNDAPLGIDAHTDSEWDDENHVRVCEYFRIVYKKDKLHVLDNGDQVKESDVKADHKRRQKADLYPDDHDDMMDTLKAHSIHSRQIQVPVVEWYLIAGSKIIDKRETAFKYIPIIRVIGEETVLDKVLDRKGHVRSLIDPQRMYNYASSSFVEHIALQTKTPFMAAVEAIAGFEENYARANVDNPAYLPFNGMDEDGNPIPKPERVQPPIPSQAYLESMKIAQNEMMLVSGQYEANLGAKSNEVSGTAVDARQRQGENATYNYIDRFAQAIRFIGRILIDLIPKIYDTPRVIKILAENGDQSSIHLDPNAPQAHHPLQNPDAPDFDPDAIQAIFNPTVGDYDVEADIGPAYATRRQETFNAISQILKVNESLTPMIGDLLFRAADFPMADEIAQRLHNMVPPQALTGQKPPDPQIQQLQQQMAQQHTVMTQATQENQDLKSKLMAMKQEMTIKEYDAETKRMTAIGGIDPAAMMPVIRQMVSEALGTPINPIIAQHALENSQMAQSPEAPPHPVNVALQQQQMAQDAQQQPESPSQ